MITIVDYGMGNLGSVLNMCKRIGVLARISKNISDLESAEKIILPGVGSFDNAMKNLINMRYDRVIREKALTEKTPILGICLGMQLLTEGSEEGEIPGLSLIPGRALRFADSTSHKVPHMGWNEVKSTSNNPILDKLPRNSRFYFVHSYYVMVPSRQYSLLNARHGITFEAGIVNDSVYGVQFHPEKSHRYGMSLLAGFSDLGLE